MKFNINLKLEAKHKMQRLGRDIILVFEIKKNHCTVVHLVSLWVMIKNAKGGIVGIFSFI